MAWSVGKENLSLSLEHIQKLKLDSHALELQKLNWIAQIEQYAGSDPLKPWVRFIKWVVEAGVLDKMVSLLELCTQLFLDDERYIDDSRYLKVWIRYADRCTDPVQVYAFLEKKKVGQKQSLFYEAYAMTLVARKEFVKAEEVCKLGIARNAEPVARLQVMYQKVLTRIFKTSAEISVKTNAPTGFDVFVDDSFRGNNVATVGNFQVSVDSDPKQENVIYNRNITQIQNSSRKSVLREETTDDIHGMCNSFKGDTVRDFPVYVDSARKQDSCRRDINQRRVSEKEETTELRHRVGNSFKGDNVPASQGFPVYADSGSKQHSGRGNINPSRNESVSRDETTDLSHSICNLQLHGDETIAIKRFAEHAIVGMDPESETGEIEDASHHGLVDQTINTREAMWNVLSMFSQPLPFQHPKRSRTHQSQPVTVNNKNNGGYSVYVDEAFGTGSKDGFQVLPDNRTTSLFEVLPDDDCQIAKSSMLDILPDDDCAKRNSKSLAVSKALQEHKSDFSVFQDHPVLEEPVTKGMDPANPTPPVTKGGLDPWDESLLMELLNGLKPPLSTYEGYHYSSKKYNGTASLASLKTSARNKIVEIGHSRYQLKGRTGEGAFAQVYQAHDSDHDATVVLKIQKPPCPWEFYIYRQLDKRIPSSERSRFGYVLKMHVYSDCSIMVADYGQHGTLQDVVNSYLALGQKMDEVLCMYYTIEMLRTLEILHSVGIIHGDFKLDNLLIRNDCQDWIDWRYDRPGCWNQQGLCLIDWGRSIDMSLLGDGTEFCADSKTSSFRCIEMVEQRPWTFQVDTYGLCCIVHCMLHGSYLQVQSHKTSDGRHVYRPRLALKRYWNTNLWEGLFDTLLNVNSCKSNPELAPIRNSFEDYLMSNASHCSKLKQLLSKQTLTMYSCR